MFQIKQTNTYNSVNIIFQKIHANLKDQRSKTKSNPLRPNVGESRFQTLKYISLDS